MLNDALVQHQDALGELKEELLLDVMRGGNNHAKLMKFESAVGDTSTLIND